MSLASLEQPLRVIRGCLLGLSPQKICQIKHDSQLLGCAFLLVQAFDDYEGTQTDFSTSSELDEDLELGASRGLLGPSASSESPRNLDEGLLVLESLVIG